MYWGIPGKPHKTVGYVLKWHFLLAYIFCGHQLKALYAANHIWGLRQEKFPVSVLQCLFDVYHCKKEGR